MDLLISRLRVRLRLPLFRRKTMFYVVKNTTLNPSLLILVALLGVAVGGTVHKVGDSKGWTMMGVDYEAWASSRTFQVGDSLVFEYNNEYHDVTQVTPNDFELFQNFICGVPGHCDAGQKLQFHVLPASLGPVAAPVPRPVRSPISSSSPSPANAPQYQHQIAPSPLQSGAS
ncbi:hypothetical protein EUTSA_v10017820mg, partial [Eutrema salsugineum]